MNRVLIPSATERKRHPGDLIRIILGVLVFLAATGMALSGYFGWIEEQSFRFLNSLPDTLFPFINPIMQVGSFATVWAVAGTLALLRRYRLAVKIAASGTTVWLIVKLAKELVRRDRPTYLFRGVIDRAHATGILGFPSGHAAIAATLATVISPYVDKKWSRLLWVVAWVVAFSRVYTGAHLPLDVIAGLSLGWIGGSLFNLIFGTPAWRIPIGPIQERLKAAHMHTAEITVANVDARGSTPLFISTTSREKFFGKLVNNENRDADLLYKLWRYITIRENEGTAPFASVKQIIEHEAYMYALAANAGAQTPKVQLATPITSTTALLLTEWIPGKTLNTYPKPLSSQLLIRVWQQVKAIHSISLAHRDLRTSNIMVDQTEQPWLIDFSFAELATTDQPLGIDRAELMVSLSLYSEPKQVVAAAMHVLGKSIVGETLPYIQSASLTRSTRKQLKTHKGLLDEIKNEIRKQTEYQESKPIQVSRFSHGAFLWISLSVLIAIIIVLQFRHIEEYVRTLKHINSRWMTAALVASILTYMSSSVAVLGSTVYSLRYLKVLMLQFATTFVDRLTPLNLGQVVLTQRFLENNGLRRPDAVASTSMLYLSGTITHIILMFVVAIAFVRHPLKLHYPKHWAIILLTVIILSIAALYAAPKIRPLLRKYLFASIGTIRQIFNRPREAFQLFGGALGISLFYALSLYCSMRGFGVNLAFDKVLLVYLAGSAIASASPVPGGLGATEVALVAGLVTFGAPEPAAVLSVLAFRFFTYLLPTLPGVFAFRSLQKNHLLDI